MNKIRLLFILGFAASTFYHLLGMINPSWTEPSPFGRHLVFVLIGLISTLLLYKNRPKPLLLLFLLIAQQLVSHGIYGYKVWMEEKRIDWASVIVCLTMPILAYYVIKQNRKK
jgi:peptidoglycan/LPS O-acetylase OafA/YrhL